MIGTFDNIKIQGMATAVPKIVEENMNYAEVLGERRTKKQIKLTGVSKRHISGIEQRTSDLCYAAAVPLLEKLSWNKEEIKVLIFITQKSNYQLPSTAFFLQKRLGLSKDCVAFDINLGCSSFNVGVHAVSALLQSCQVSDKALLLVGDIASRVLKADDVLNEDIIAHRMLFGSAGSAIALEKVENNSLKFMTKSDGEGYDVIIQYSDYQTFMNGTAVFEFAINDVADDVKEFKKYFGLQEKDIDYYVFHQAQKLILDNIVSICDIPEEKELRSIEEYGNTSGTSVPLTVCANRDKFAGKEKVKLYLCGFGVGLSWGAIYTELSTENILPVIETDEHYDEDKKPCEGLEDKYILVLDSDLPVGESLCRYLNMKSAKVVLAGSDEQKLNDIQDDFCFESHKVLLEPSSNCEVDKIVSYCDGKNIKLNGVVFANPNMERSVVEKIISSLTGHDILSSQASFVLLSDIEGLRSSNQELYRAEKTKLSDFVSDLELKYEASFMEDFRINAVLYDPEKADMIQITGNGQKWIEKYLKEGCPPNMMKQIYIGHAVKHLLSDESVYTSGTLLTINR